MWDSLSAPSRRDILLTAAIVCVYLAFAVSFTLTKRPFFDEAAFANPALDLIKRGSMGMTIQDPLGAGGAPGKEQVHLQTNVYYSMPLSHLGLAAWFKLVGFGFYRMRIFHVLWGLVALASWGYIIRTLTGSAAPAWIAAFLLATDRGFLDAATSGRPDLLSATFASLAIAAYLYWQERNLGTAILISQTFITAAFFTHPIGSLLDALIVALVLRFDFRRLRWKHVLFAAVPFIVGFGMWGLYIGHDVEAFRTQFGRNASGRADSLFSPLKGISNEIRIRFLDFVYLPPYAAGLRRLTVLIPVVYFLAAIALLFRTKGARLFGILAVVNFFVYALLEGHKPPFYLVHITPLLCCCLGVWMWTEWNDTGFRRWAAVAVTAGLVLLQTTWIAYACWLNPYRNVYMPAMTFLSSQAGSKASIMGDAELGFYFGFYNNVLDDTTLGYYSGRRSDFIVIDENGYREVFKDFPAFDPGLDRYIQKTLTEDYREIYRNPVYTIYQRR